MAFTQGADAITGNTASQPVNTWDKTIMVDDIEVVNVNYDPDALIPGADEAVVVGDWQGNLYAQMLNELKATGDVLGEDKYVMTSFLDANFQGLLNYVQDNLFGGDPVAAAQKLTTRAGILQASMGARLYLQSKWSDLGPAWSEAIGSPGGGGGGGGGGRSTMPTEAEIRQNFDIDQLAAQAQNTWRGLLFDELDDPRGLARQYIDKVVASGGQQKIDFQTFVQTAAKATGRYGAMYKNKPEGMSEGQFFAPYMQSAQQIMGANDDAINTGMAGAMMGASQDSFQGMLNLTDQVQQSAPFITGMENRLTDLRKVFRE